MLTAKNTAQTNNPTGDGNPTPVTNSNYCIDIVGLRKSFKRQTLNSSSYTSLKSGFLSLLKSPFSSNRRKKQTNYSETAAIKDLTVRILPGQAVGIIGRNGSGKSTLLKLVTGIYKPDSGKVCVNGRLAALIELGAGFHPDFSGRENVYLAGAMFGLSKSETDRCFDQIVSFAELEAVIDDPVRTYSSGMFMRLGFSVAVHTDPDVLLIDEVLAVGDANFTVKCKEKLNELKREGKTFLLVSHDLASVERWCDEVIWLHEGVVKDRGEPRRVIDHYREFIEKGEEEQLALRDASQQQLETLALTEQETVEENNIQPNKTESFFEHKRWGSKEIEITKVELEDAKGEKHFVFHPESNLNLKIHYKFNDLSLAQNTEKLVFGIGIHRSDGTVILGTNTDIERLGALPLNKQGVVTYTIPRIGLLDGQYRLDVAAHRQDGYPYDYHQSVLTFSIRSVLGQIGVISPEHQWSFS
jgi:lipopolysaccharide transport system ATP-binding protein